jgi:hypothetical protein
VNVLHACKLTRSSPALNGEIHSPCHEWMIFYLY